MKKLNQVLIVLMVSLVLATMGFAQDSSTSDSTDRIYKEFLKTNANSVKVVLHENARLLKLARDAQKNGELLILNGAVESYTRNTEAISEALLDDGYLDSNDRLSVLEKVNKATKKHIAVLERLLTKVPEQARPGIERALQVSRKGNEAATSALAKDREAKMAAKKERRRELQKDRSNRPSRRADPPSGRPASRPSRPPRGGGPPG